MHHESRLARRAVHFYRQMDKALGRALDEGVPGAGYSRLDRISLNIDAEHLAAFPSPVEGRVFRVKGKRALAALDVGGAHRGQQPAVELLRRICDRDAEHRAGYPLLAQEMRS